MGLSIRESPPALRMPRIPVYFLPALMLALAACGLPRQAHAYTGAKPWKEHCADVARVVAAVAD